MVIKFNELHCLDYDDEVKAKAEILAAVNIMKQMMENGMITENEYRYIYRKYAENTNDIQKED